MGTASQTWPLTPVPYATEAARAPTTFHCCWEMGMGPFRHPHQSFPETVLLQRRTSMATAIWIWSCRALLRLPRSTWEMGAELLVTPATIFLACRVLELFNFPLQWQLPTLISMANWTSPR